MPKRSEVYFSELEGIKKALAHKYDFEYPEDKLIHLSKEVKTVVDDLAKYTNWSKLEDIRAELKVDLIILLAENDYSPEWIEMKYTKRYLNRRRILRRISNRDFDYF